MSSKANTLSFQTLDDCHHIDHNSTEMHSLYKRRYRLSINILLIYITIQGHFISNQSGPPGFYVRNSNQLLWNWDIFLPKFLDWNCMRPFGSSIGFVYITVYAVIAKLNFVNKRQWLYSSYWYKIEYIFRWLPPKEPLFHKFS